MKRLFLSVAACFALTALVSCTTTTTTTATTPSRDSSGPVVRDVIPAGNAHEPIPVVQTHSP